MLQIKPETADATSDNKAYAKNVINFAPVIIFAAGNPMIGHTGIS